MALSREEKADKLRRVDLFAALPEEVLAAAADRAVEVEFPAGRQIVRQGEVGTGLFVLTSGRAKVVRDGEQIAELVAGDFFGELSVIDQEPRIAQVVAEEPVSCLALASWDFEKVLTDAPSAALTLLRTVTRRLRAAGEQHHH
jgi:CRP/FNR family transcriptional regulator, cyclic AMP receptor protein